ncbi:hypothetical protein BJ944DRAFT_238119 [Cunninghamella echinulata]|nr:hypothetical protein BJ944DRAFT_238119 [Cunninghamella echinulata]
MTSSDSTNNLRAMETDVPSQNNLSIINNNNNNQLPSLSSILNWQPEPNSSSQTNLSPLISSDYILPPLLLSQSILNSSHHHHSNNIRPTNHNFFTSNINSLPNSFNPANNDNNKNDNNRKIRKSKRSKIITRASNMLSLSGNTKSHPSSSSSSSTAFMHPDHLNNNINMNDDNDSNTGRSMSISSSSSSSSSFTASSNIPHSMNKPRWKENERINLLKAIVKEKQLDDMTSFSWDKIALAVGRAKKACKDQWRREVLPALIKNLK